VFQKKLRVAIFVQQINNNIACLFCNKTINFCKDPRVQGFRIRDCVPLYITLILLPVSSVYTHPQEECTEEAE
jgi:hypothetical protein